MNKEEMLAKIESLSVEVRSIADELLDTSKDVNEVRSRLDSKKEELRKAKQELAQLDMPKDTSSGKEEVLFNAEELRKLAKGELRSITIGTNAGSTKSFDRLFEQIGDKDELLSKVQMVFGKDALTKIPVLNDMGDLTSSTEATTSVTVDTEAGISITELEPKSYPRCLPVSAEAMTLGIVELESRMPGIFEKAFKKAMRKGMIVGAGTDGDAMTGIFTQVNSDIASATSAGDFPTRVISGGVSMSNLGELAVAVSGKDEEYTIIMSPSVYGALLADTATDETTKLYKETLIRDKSIENVKVSINSYAPANAATAKKAMVVAVPLARYCIGVAREVNIDIIKAKGDKNTYFQAIPFIDGKQADNRDLYAIANSPTT